MIKRLTLAVAAIVLTGCAATGAMFGTGNRVAVADRPDISVELFDLGAYSACRKDRYAKGHMPGGSIKQGCWKLSKDTNKVLIDWREEGSEEFEHQEFPMFDFDIEFLSLLNKKY